jgi:hypothetical protein
MLATGKALDVMARSMQAGADATSATSDVQKARIKAELDYKETIEKARDALGNVPKGMSPDDWLTVMAPRARAVEEAAAAQRFSAIDAATKGQYGAVAGFLNTETDPEDKAVSDLLKTYDAMRQIADGNRELEERLEKAFQERLSEIRRSYKVKQYNENQDFLAQTLADETEFLARETRILQQEDEKRYARTSTFRGLLGASANRGNLFSGLWKTFSQYQDQLDRNPFDPNLRAGLKAARNAEMAEQLQGIVDQYPEGRAYATLGSLGRRGTPAEFARLRMFPGGSRLAERAMFANRLGSMTDSDRAMLRMLPGGGMLVDASQQAYNAPMSDADRAMLRRTPAGRQLLARLDQEDRSRAIAGEYDRQTGGKPLDPATMKLLGDAVKHLQDISAALKN